MRAPHKYWRSPAPACTARPARSVTPHATRPSGKTCQPTARYWPPMPLRRGGVEGVATKGRGCDPPPPAVTASVARGRGSPGVILVELLLFFLPTMKTISFSFLSSRCIFYLRDDN